MTKFYMLFGAVAVIGVGVVGYNVSSGMLSSAATTPVVVEGLEDPAKLVELAQGISKGDGSSPVTIVEFGDFQCPSCAAFASSVKPQVELSFIDNGQAEFVFYDYPLTSIHPNAFFAARAARCAQDQGKFWEYHDELFRNQSRWAAEAAPGGSFRDYAETAGLDEGEFTACLNSDRHAELVSANIQLGQVMGVTGTPTIFVNVQGVGTRQAPGFDYQSVARTIEEMTAQAAGSN